ncbi:MAG: hypothetical protein Kow002_19980 [Anaerolineales bacterium]
MNALLSFAIEVILTLVACFLLARYLRPHLRKVLLDLCGTEERAQFWTIFSNILLVGLPVIISLGFRPEGVTFEESAFEIIGRLSGNLAGFIFALVLVGIGVGFFALVAPRPKAEAK